MKKFLLVLSSVVIFGLWAAPGSPQDHGLWKGAGPGRMLMGGGPGMLLPLILKKLDLTAEQQAKAQQIMASHRGTFQTLFPQMEAAHDALAEKLFTPGPLTAGDLTAQTGQISQLREQLMNEGLAVVLEVRNLLTPEQLAKAAQLQEKMKVLHAEMRGLLEENE